MDLSIILGGRDDNYGENFIERLNQSVSTNLKKLDHFQLDYEMIVVDFNPINDSYLYKNKILESTLTHPRVKNIIVDNSVILTENLGPKIYYEYFAKNVGCRNSSGKCIFIINSDILMTDHLIEDIVDKLNSSDYDDYFYRVRYRGQVPLGSIFDEENESVEDLNRQEFSDACICGYYAGDASFFSREVFFNVATGYNEGDKDHRSHVNQSGMDTEILWNLYKKGKKLKFLESRYYHILHDHNVSRNHFINTEVYENKDDWGFVKYDKKIINNNTIMIYDSKYKCKESETSGK
jgi:hypothetical protein